MKPEELRIGNYILRNDLGDGHERVEQILELGEKVTTTGAVKVLCDYEDIKPIPLTEEWLYRIELTAYDIKNMETLPSEKISISKELNLSDLRTRYIHQLQNLYFALTKEELQFKELA